MAVGPGDATRGDPLALSTAVAFVDLDDPRARAVVVALRDLSEAYGGRKLRVVWKSPAPASSARRVTLAGAAVLTAAGPTAFWTYVERLFVDGWLVGSPGAAVERAAQAAGVDAQRLAAVERSPEVARLLDEHARLAQTVSVAAPAILVNGFSCAARTGFPFSDAAATRDRLSVVVDEEIGRARSALVEGMAPERIYAERSADNLRGPRRMPSALADDETTVFDVPIGNSPVRGAATALVTLVEFADFQDPFCRRVQPMLAELSKRYGADLRLVFKHQPLPFHVRAQPAAELAAFAFANKGQGAFWKVHDALWAAPPRLESWDLARAGAMAGLPIAQVQQALATHRNKDLIDVDQALARRLRANGIPHFFVNGRRLAGAQPLERFRAVIDDELASARSLVARGVRPEDLYDTIRKDAVVPPEVAAPPPLPPPASPPLRQPLIDPLGVRN